MARRLARVGGDARRMLVLRRALRLPRRPTPVAIPTQESPLVSIVVPTRQRWRFLNASLRALASSPVGVPYEMIKSSMTRRTT